VSRPILLLKSHTKPFLDSLNLIKGSIDQVNSIADIHWVQPRVLDNAQTQALLDRLDQWAAHVGVVGDEVGSYKQPFAVSV
jgi:26S proteasome regulatory subunit N9